MGLGHLGLPGGQVLERSSWRLRLDGRGKGGGASRAGPLPLPFPSVGPGGRPLVGPGGGLGAYGRRAGVLALAGARRMKGHSCYAMCGAVAALGERSANTVRTATRQDGQALDGSQRPEGVLFFPRLGGCLHAAASPSAKQALPLPHLSSCLIRSQDPS